jgi:WbqC-like protein family
LSSRERGRTLVVLQPGYLPWLGFFDQMRRSDIFVFYDDVQFDKHGWRNRNRIKSPAGPHWLTVPVRHEGLGQLILEVEIDNRQPWVRKHVGAIRQFYAGAAHLKRYLPELEALFERRWERIVDLDLALIEQMCRWLGLSRRTVRSSELTVGGERTERLLNLCLHFGASRYLSGDSAKEYLDVDLFARHGVRVEWQGYRHPVYPQQHGEFVPYLSALDLLLNCGDESAAILSGDAPLNEA